MWTRVFLLRAFLSSKFVPWRQICLRVLRRAPRNCRFSEVLQSLRRTRRRPDARRRDGARASPPHPEALAGIVARLQREREELEVSDTVPTRSRILVPSAPGASTPRRPRDLNPYEHGKAGDKLIRVWGWGGARISRSWRRTLNTSIWEFGKKEINLSPLVIFCPTPQLPKKFTAHSYWNWKKKEKIFFYFPLRPREMILAPNVARVFSYPRQKIVTLFFGSTKRRVKSREWDKRRITGKNCSEAPEKKKEQSFFPKLEYIF